ncbi:hypothetical protein IFR05_005531 [Cadophora sp. M221]|nr:hypothetical protein IFR05_005531 [Cadophora sp. M221]
MAKPPTKEARRRREKRAKKIALSLTNDPTNPAPLTPKAPAPKPQITKPHIVKPSISYGLQVSDLILRDTINLHSLAPPQTNSNEHAAREKMAKLAKLVLSQADHPGRQLHTVDKTPSSSLNSKTKPIKLTSTPTPSQAQALAPASKSKTRYNAHNKFKFSKLPTELRVMIEEYVFTASSGKKPRMLWAMKGNRELYPEAKEVWCKVNEFGLTYHESALNRIREGMDGAEREMVRRAGVVVSKDIQACTIFSPIIHLFPHLTHLTLHIYSTTGLSLSIHHIIPQLSRLRQVTVQIRGPKRSIHSHFDPFDGTEFFRSFSKTRMMLDRMLDRSGKCVRVGAKVAGMGLEGGGCGGGVQAEVWEGPY